MTEKPWWLPQLADGEYFARLRADYPDKADWSDERLNDWFNASRKYAVTWDHEGDAYEQFEALADAYLALLSREVSEPVQDDQMGFDKVMPGDYGSSEDQ